MSRRRKRPSPRQAELPPPVNVIDGIPDRSPRPARWKYLVILGIFLAWAAFLVYCGLAG